VIGVGLIGGSLAKALRECNAVGEVIGCGRDADHLQRAVDQDVIDHFELHPEQAVKNADMVLLSIPVGAMADMLKIIKPHLTENCVITDVGSTKGSVVEAVKSVFGSIPAGFVPGHPIAGTEKSGVDASYAGLFHNRRVVLTPLPETSTAALQLVNQMWDLTGAKVWRLSVAEHDHLLAVSSHLPHVLAYSLVDTLASMPDHQDIFRFSAGGFRDFTRIASSDPQMWHDICLNNRKELLAALQSYIQGLQHITQALENADGDALLKCFARAKAARDEHIE
jgi:prephenate dehydrogenase